MVADAAPQEIEHIDIGSPLDNPRREKFCSLVALGVKPWEAYRDSGYCPNGSEKTWVGNAHKMRQEPEIALRIAELVRFSSTDRTLTTRRRRELLAAIAETPVTQFIGVDLANAGEVRRLGRAVFALKGAKVKTFTGDDGQRVSEMDLDLHDKIAAIREDAILAGERRTDSSQVNVGIVVDLGAALATMGGGAGAERPLAADLVSVHESPQNAPESVLPPSPSPAGIMAPSGPVGAENGIVATDALGLVGGGGGGDRAAEVWTDD